MSGRWMGYVLIGAEASQFSAKARACLRWKRVAFEDRNATPEVYRDIVEQNLREMIRVAGNAARLRPHCKTHKMPEITKLQLAAGITKHKCATLAEAEMLADAGAYGMVMASRYNLRALPAEEILE